MDAYGDGTAQAVGRPTAGRRSSISAVASAVGPWLGTAVLPFVLVVYLAMHGGGYDPIVRGEVGLAAWWILLLGAAVGELPRSSPTRAAVGAASLFTLFGVWALVGVSGAESEERAVAEVARIVSLLGVFLLAVAGQGAEGLRRTVGAVAAAIAVVGGLALLSRLEPGWFPVNETAKFLPSLESRLNYPINYWNGLAALVVIGVPLLCTIALSARMVLVRALAAAAVPALVLTAFFTLSRGGALELAVAMAVWVLLWPRRMAAMPLLLLVTLGSGLLVAGALQRDELQDALMSELAASQADSMTAMVLVVCVGVGLFAAALAYLERSSSFLERRLSPRSTGMVAGVTALILVASGIGAGAPAEFSDRWDEFKNPIEQGSTSERFASASGNSRYEYWQSSVEAFETSPLDGIGPGSFEYWWAREGTVPGFIRDAHSLYFETLAELGVVGLALLAAFFAWLLASGLARLRGASVESRMLLAGALAAMSAFLVAAMIDWVWEITVLPVAFLLLAAAVVGHPGQPAGTNSQQPDGWRHRLPVVRLGVVFLALVALVPVGISLAGDKVLRSSQAAAANGQFELALEHAKEADRIEPFAATPNLQEALILEVQGDLDGAATAAAIATADEPTNWRTWLTRSRIQAESGDAQGAVRSYRKARSLNPRSVLFQGG